MRKPLKALIPCKNFPQGKIHPISRNSNTSTIVDQQGMIRITISTIDLLLFNSMFNVKVHQECLYIKAFEIHLEYLGINIMIIHTTRHMSTRYGLSSIKHESKCDDERISLQRCNMQISVVEKCAKKGVRITVLSTWKLSE